MEQQSDNTSSQEDLKHLLYPLLAKLSKRPNPNTINKNLTLKETIKLLSDQIDNNNK